MSTYRFSILSGFLYAEAWIFAQHDAGNQNKENEEKLPSGRRKGPFLSDVAAFNGIFLILFYL